MSKIPVTVLTGFLGSGKSFLEDEVTGLAWHPDRRTLVAADASGTVCAWAVD